MIFISIAIADRNLIGTKERSDSMAMTVVDKDCTEKAECFVNTVAEANYERGFKDGYAKAIEEFAEALINKTKNYEFANFLESSWSHAYATLHFKNCVNEIAKQMKGEQYHAIDRCGCAD